MARFVLCFFLLIPVFVRADIAADTVSHAAFDALLKKYVTPAGVVNYKGFIQDKVAFQAYLDLLSQHAPQADWSYEHRLSYWINAYNAFTIKLIMDNYPVKSIRDLHQGKPWDHKFIKIGTQTYSLNDIEHNILRKQFSEPRIHFAINCASKSCPPLLNQAYTAASVGRQLDRVARTFIRNTRLNTFTAQAAEVSSIFDWYKDDFTKKGTLIAYLNKYASVQLSADAVITYKSYDWSLNE
ncbi:MAG: DUF547 domain-containing protein [Bacteroidia bacterium]|nr:DUF547 domain-containing protein [Bacteroidia bacterium]